MTAQRAVASSCSGHISHEDGTGVTIARWYARSMDVPWRSAATFAAIAVAGCAAQQPPSPESRPPLPPSSFPTAFRCDAAAGPLPDPQPWPFMIEAPLDAQAADHAAELNPMIDRARALEAKRSPEACDLYAQAFRLGISYGLRPRVSIGRVGGDWICPEVLMEYLPYAGSRYLVPETVDPSGRVGGGCNSFVHDKPFEGFRTDYGGVWVQLYLVGVEWFRLGNYDEAINCFGLIPPEHYFANVAEECASLSQRFAAERPTNMPRVRPNDARAE